ncbi:MAG: phosphoribosylformylglycinamidine synthase subunit PurS [Rhodospirillales bacterium]|nr:phosphoribosylformylglycinamidine synthase subunit PurS [Rhodospirillales bacterium]MDE0711742.1 phosphoribosylformylglycinamidine synthase subunit PurS [Rhodospirillales bacterium]
MKAIVHVVLKKDVLDPQGKAVEAALQTLGFGEVSEVRQGKFFEITLDGHQDDAPARLDRMCEELLANPVIEDYRITIPDA